MSTGRDDLDHIVKISSLQEGEPIFVLRAQDANAANAVRAWASLSMAAGVPPAVIEQALQQADRMDAWSAKKLPDADHLQDCAAKHLAYQLDRRAWKAMADIDAKTILHERRGALVVLGRLLSIVQARLGHEAAGDIERELKAAFALSPVRAAGDLLDRLTMFIAGRGWTITDVRGRRVGSDRAAADIVMKLEQGGAA